MARGSLTLMAVVSGVAERNDQVSWYPSTNIEPVRLFETSAPSFSTTGPAKALS